MRRAIMSVMTVVLATGFGIGAAPPAKAWGKFGHLTICDLAYRNLTDTSQAAIGEILQSRSGGITVRGRGRMPDQHYTAFNYGCLEEDEVPRRYPDDHFINVARDVRQIGSACTAGASCILAGIERDFATLKDRSKPREERAFALMALGHWVGDIHQPLHVSFADDKGGNGIDIALIGNCGTSREAKPDNLHAVWDKCLLDAGLFERVRKRADYKPQWSRFTITYRAVDTIQANRNLTAVKSWVATVPADWANESYSITLAPGTSYCTSVGTKCQYSSASLTKTNPKRVQRIDQAYLASYQGAASEQVAKAGFRLAHLLNLALDPAYSGPT
ncbi:S1/P1 nuclease [Sphingopyxis sp.]|uniref:S1/P1 nuclease n=1 Tax=Sphingopyxis sp. TaxID=1908224 RepID=UPI003D6D0166